MAYAAEYTAAGIFVLVRQTVPLERGHLKRAGPQVVGNCGTTAGLLDRR